MVGRKKEKPRKLSTGLLRYYFLSSIPQYDRSRKIYSWNHTVHCIVSSLWTQPFIRRGRDRGMNWFTFQCSEEFDKFSIPTEIWKRASSFDCLLCCGRLFTLSAWTPRDHFSVERAVGIRSPNLHPKFAELAKFTAIQVKKQKSLLKFAKLADCEYDLGSVAPLSPSDQELLSYPVGWLGLWVLESYWDITYLLKFEILPIDQKKR